MSKILQIKIDHDGGVSEYTITSASGCAYKNLMSKNMKMVVKNIVTPELEKELQAEREKVALLQEAVDLLPEMLDYIPYVDPLLRDQVYRLIRKLKELGEP